MKTIESPAPVSALKYSRTVPFDCTGWVNFKTPGSLTVRIRLDDECRNGHEDFAITAEINHPSVRRDCLACGCLHDEILKVLPELRPFVALHLSDWNGAPRYAVENGFYHLTEGNLDVLQEHLRCTPEEARKLAAECRSKAEFAVMLQEMGFRERWKKEADAAIEKLQALCGGAVFESKATRQNFPPVSLEILADVKEKQAAGYYLPENVAARKEAARQEAIAAAVAKVEEDFAAASRKLADQRLVSLYFAKRGTSSYDENIIWYDHTRELVFNWKSGGPGKVWSQEEFIDFMNTCDRSELPADLEFRIK